MSEVAKLIDLIVQGKNTEASEVLNQELMGRSYQALRDIKPEVASEYFAGVTDVEEDDQVEDESNYESEYSPEPEEEYQEHETD